MLLHKRGRHKGRGQGLITRVKRFYRLENTKGFAMGYRVDGTNFKNKCCNNEKRWTKRLKYKMAGFRQVICCLTNRIKSAKTNCAQLNMGLESRVDQSLKDATGQANARNKLAWIWRRH